jgi:hypothetical protein
MASHSTTLRWGPKSERIADLRDFRDRVIKYLDHARQRAAENPMYSRMVPIFEAELISIMLRIQARSRKYARRQPVAA